ncbi:hypothetical protein L4D76_09700 [Photobacterium sagamiensis]|uniref:hypothetical protein n=1 Tax=Photobacterium sagamiensis TaxID=2910241 RepID=UPI003D0CD107
MKKLLITLTAVFGLLGSMSAFAAAELNAADIKRIDKEVTSMVEFLNLSDSEGQTIIELKKGLTLNNREAVSKFGRGSAEFKKARKQIMKAYQAKLYKIVTREELKGWQKAKRG